MKAWLVLKANVRLPTDRSSSNEVQYEVLKMGFQGMKNSFDVSAGRLYPS